MKKRKILKLLIFISMSLLLTSCSKLDVSEYTTVIAMGIDKAENGVKVSVQAINDYVLGDEASNNSPVVVFSTEAETIYDAYLKLGTYSANKLFIFHIKCLVIGYELAQEGIQKYMEFFTYYWETQHCFNIVIARDDTAENVLKMRSILSPIPAIAVESKLENAEKVYGIGKVTFVDELVTYLYIPNANLTLSSIQIEGEPEEGKDNQSTETTDPKMRLKVSTIGVFKEDKLIGWLTEEESLGFRHITAEFELSVLHIEYQGKPVNIFVKSASAKMSFSLVDNKPVITIKHKMTVTVTETIKIEDMDLVKNKINEDAKRLMNQAVIAAQQKYNSDIFMFCEVIHRNNPKYYQSIKNKYDEIFPEIKVEYQFNTIIKRSKLH